MLKGTGNLGFDPHRCLLEYIKSLCWKHFAASAGKRLAATGTKYVLVKLLVPSALSSSVTYLMTSTAGTTGKNVVCYGFDKLSQDSHGTVMLAIPEEDLEPLKSKLAQDPAWSFSLSQIGSKIKKSIKNKAIDSCHSILNITYQDVSQGTGALIGSTLASAAFIAFMGPPSLFVLPLYFLAEGCTKSLGAFLGTHWGRYILGPKIFKPAILNTWHALMGAQQKNLENGYSSTLYELEKISFSEENILGPDTPLLNSWYLFKEQEEQTATLKHSMKAFTLIEDYEGSKTSPTPL